MTLSENEMLAIWNLAGHILSRRLTTVPSAESIEDAGTEAFKEAMRVFLNVRARAQSYEGVVLPLSPTTYLEYSYTDTGLHVVNRRVRHDSLQPQQDRR